MNLLYDVHVWGLRTTELLQRRFSYCDQFFTWLSTIGDPSLLYVIYFPIVYAIFPRLGLKILHAAAIGEWLNLFMKWVFHGERPYWWVHEQNLTSTIQIEQYYNTCETGPGTPSGHVAITTMAYFVLADAAALKAKSMNRSGVHLFIWIFFTIIIILMGFSRAFIAAHFIHQCIFGFFSGLPFGILISSMTLEKYKLKHYIFGTLFAIGSIAGIQLFMSVMGIDVGWTVKLAEKWCLRRSWIHVATSPNYVMWRFAGGVLGLGLVRCSKYYEISLNQRLSFIHKLLFSIVSLSISQIGMFLISSVQHNALALYFCTFTIYSLIIYTVGIILPKTFSSYSLKDQAND